MPSSSTRSVAVPARRAPTTAAAREGGKKLVMVTKGRHFVATVVGNTVTIKIVKGAGKSVIKRPGMVPMNAPACIEAYIAWYAWYAAVAALCGAVAVANPIAGLVCALAFGFFEFTLIDFNNACKNGSDV